MLFFTGFPGFLGSELLPRALAHDDGGGQSAVCLVQPKFTAVARQRLDDLVASGRIAAGTVRLVEGDVTRPDLGIGSAHAALAGSVTGIFHLAAVYDLAVGRDLAMRVNVDGTRHVLAFAARCTRLRCFQYVSTCYVSGRYGGRFRETHLQEGQPFNNFYEETKYLAEVLVRDAMASGLPATVYRPAIVVGNSHTGATQKYDGPYHTIRWLLWQPRVTLLPLPFGAAANPLNVVPSDFVLDAIDYLASRPESAGRTYQLADPEPLTIAGMVDTLARTIGCRVVILPVPFGVARTALNLPGIPAIAPIAPAMLAYTVHPTQYDTTAASAALAGSGIACPRFTAYAPRLVDFVRAHPDVGAEAMA